MANESHTAVSARTIAQKWNNDLARRGEYPRNRYRARPMFEVGENDPWQFGKGPRFERET